jgi:hypothetical protein
MSEFVLLLHENPSAFKDMSATQMQDIVQRYGAWAATLAARNALVAGKKLRDEGGLRLQRGRDGIVASDGPYAEAKDIVGGFFIVSADSYAEARKLVADCPHLDYGWIELREIDPA